VDAHGNVGCSAFEARYLTAATVYAERPVASPENAQAQGLPPQEHLNCRRNIMYGSLAEQRIHPPEDRVEALPRHPSPPPFRHTTDSGPRTVAGTSPAPARPVRRRWDGHVDIHTPGALHRWAAKLRVPDGALKAAVLAVGPREDRVMDFLTGGGAGQQQAG
jgi:hypothetical protein